MNAPQFHEDFIISVYSASATIELLRDIIRAQRARVALLELTVQEMHVAALQHHAHGEDAVLHAEIDRLFRARYLFNSDVLPEQIILVKEKPK